MAMVVIQSIAIEPGSFEMGDPEARAIVVSIITLNKTPSTISIPNFNFTC